MRFGRLVVLAGNCFLALELVPSADERKLLIVFAPTLLLGGTQLFYALPITTSATRRGSLGFASGCRLAMGLTIFGTWPG